MALTLERGQTFENFEILDVLRKHETAWIYRVRAPGHDAPVALKLSVEPVASEQVARRALREIAVLGELTNAHVVKVHDSGMAGDHWYILMEDLQGAQLDRWHDFNRPLPAPDAVRIVHQACLGLAEVHAKGVVHRDLKPSALWLEPDGNVKILDFSSARAWGGQSAMGDNVTTHRAMVGAPPYAAPEQFHAPELSPATDVYSLGVILYELLSGHSPFFSDRSRNKVHADLRDEPMEWITAHAKRKPIPLAKHHGCADLPAELVEAIDAALAKDPKDRPVDAGDLANRLGWTLHHSLGKAQAAILATTDPGGVTSYHLVLPGSHRIGFGPSCDVPLRRTGGDEAVALLEWDGVPKLAELRAMGAGDVQIGGKRVETRAPIERGQVAAVAGFTLTLSYPAR